jgi:hypothetical protein
MKHFIITHTYITAFCKFIYGITKKTTSLALQKKIGACLKGGCRRRRGRRKRRQLRRRRNKEDVTLCDIRTPI